MTVNEIICSNIAELRKKQGLSQEELASMLGVTFQAVSKWENQLSCPDIALIPKIAEIFHLSIDSLFGKAEAKMIDEKLVDWPDDDNLYAVIFQGHRLLKEDEITDNLSEIELLYDGDMQGMSIKSNFSITVKGDIIDSSIQSGTHITCADIVNSDIKTGFHLNAIDIVDCDSICTGAHINATDINCKSINAGTHINATNIFRNEE